ncbi:MAG TPA: 5-oxoprolinase subunit PxpA [Gammaproteobacteria bacterium]|nr:5-oxoprolinase subunit PxpA [Gammaproteobacteria bacterium]
MRIDLNADVGEECGDDAALIPLLTSANVCCGAHAGGDDVMRRTVDLCLRHSVSVGAHFSYPDRTHFGRRELELAPEELHQSILRQLDALDGIVCAAGASLRYFKAHGALYNRMASDVAVADTVLGALREFDASLPFLTLPESAAMQRAGALGMTAIGEAFADRGYSDNGRLQPRGETDALMTDPAAVASRALAWIRTGMMQSVTGKLFGLRARSLCVHGDTPGAVALASALRKVLLQAGVELQAFA